MDTKLRMGASLPEGTARILGWDATGVVEAVGDRSACLRWVKAFYAGDMTRAGTTADLHAVDERLVEHKPVTLGWSEAAAMPLTAITA